MKKLCLIALCLTLFVPVLGVFSSWISKLGDGSGKVVPANHASTPVPTVLHEVAGRDAVPKKEVFTPEPTPEPTPAPTAEPTTLQGWAESVAKSVYISNKLISVSCEQVDSEDAPMITIYAQYPDTFLRDNDERMGAFLFNAMKVTWKLADLAREGKIEYGSVSIHGRTTFLDKYGNELEGDAASIRIKASEAAKVNWSYSTFTGDMLPGIAVAFGIHPIIRDGLSAQYYATIRK